MLKLDDTRAGAIRAKLDAVDWADVIPKVTLYAHRRLGRSLQAKERAKELVQDAITQLYDPARVRWDAESEPDIAYVLCGLVNGLVMNERRRASRTREQVVEDRKLNAYAGGQTPEELLDIEQQRAQGLAMLKGRVANDAEATVLVDLVARRIDEAGEQARESRIPLRDVRNARKRMFRAAEAVALEMEERRAREENDVDGVPSAAPSSGEVA